MILCLGKPVDFNARYVMVSIGLLITMMMVLGENFNTFSQTVFTIPALVPINSSLVIPGFLGIPEVITTTSLLAVLE